MAVFKVNREVVKKYYDSRSACQVLGCLMQAPRLVMSRQYPIIADYFATKNHRILYEVIEELAHTGLQEIGLADIENWMAKNSVVAYNRFFEMSDESEWILALIEDANMNNYEYYFNIVRKYSYLRDKINSGQDVSDILDESEIDTAILERQREEFLRMSLQDIIRHFDKKNIEIKQRYNIRGDENSRKSGDNVDELVERFKLAPQYGWRSESPRLDAITRGCRRGMFTVESKDSGTGKTRMGVFQLCLLSCDTLWNATLGKFMPNPYGATVPTLYVGTEMDLEEEIEPIILATISGVDEDKIKTYNLTPEEEERLNTAKEISKRAQIFLENEPNYNCDFFWDIVETHVTKNNIGAMIVDYLEMTPALATEYSQMTRGMQVKEDQVLFNLSTQLKNIAKAYKIYVKGYTQISDNARRDFRIRDSGAIKGCKSLQMRADLAICTFRPDKEEMALIKGYLEEREAMGKPIKTPNIVLHIYKNRGGKKVMIKIWGYVNLGTMVYQDLFVTDWNYKVITINPLMLFYKEPEAGDNDTGVEQTVPKSQSESNHPTDEDFNEFTHVVDNNDELPFDVDPETGEIIERPVEEKTSRVSRRRKKE